jgi:hypothetical protein
MKHCACALPKNLKHGVMSKGFDEPQAAIIAQAVPLQPAHDVAVGDQAAQHAHTTKASIANTPPCSSESATNMKCE